MGRARNFCCSCWTTRDDPSPPTPPQGSGISSSEKGGPSKGDGSSVPGVCYLTDNITEAAAVAMDGKELAKGNDPSPPHPPTQPERSGISSSEKGGPSKGDGSSVPGVCDLTHNITEAAAVAMDGKELAKGDDPSPPHPPTQPEGSGISSSEKGGPSKGDDSSVPGVCDLTHNITKAAAVAMHGKELANADLDGLIDYISGLLEIIREKSPLKKLAEEKLQQKKSSKKKSPAPNFWSMITSTELLNFKEFLTGVTELASAMKELFSANSVAVHVLKEIGHTSLATACLAVFATVLERFENVSEIREECLDLFEKMYSLAKHVRELQRVPRLKEELKDLLKKATELILEASILCCFQIDSSKFARFFKMSDNKANLLRLGNALTEMYREMDNEKFLSLYNVVSDNAISQKRRKAVPIEYPQGTVGMDEKLERVKKLLKWESEEKALAVVVHGFGGLGKTTLADAVYATLFDTIEGCQYCMVKLFDTIESTPNVIDLQTQLIKDLRTGTTEEAEAMPEIKTFEQGQREISHLLDQQVAFIYIDNVLHGDALQQLLPPQGMRKARKLRLLLTARDATATDSIISVKREFYPIETLPDTEAEKLIKKVLDVNEKQLNPSQMDQIVSICGGVPKLLEVVAGFIGCAGEAEDAFDTVMENNWEGNIGDDIECYVFACNKLEKDLREAFLDICSFFQEWDWEELSNIVGKPALHSLQRRTLVTKDVKSMTATVHDVILTVGLRETKKERFRFSSASEIREFLDQENEALENIKGIWSSDNSDHPLKISATKLDLMAASLRVLKLGRVTVVEDKCRKKFKELIFFSAGISHLPFDVSMSEELRHLCYSPEDLQNLSQMPPGLRHIDFQLKSSSFQITSKCIKQLSKLRVLRLKNAEFKRLPQNLGDLGDGLQEVTLETCKFLEELPESISTLGSLRVLRMDSCSRLTQLPEDFGKLTSLQELHFSECHFLKALPTSLGKLTSLQELHLARCENLAALPGSVEELSSLRLLDLSESGIEDLPYGLGKLTSLINLLLQHCQRLKSIPKSIWRLTSLDSINLSWTPLKELPDRFCDLSSITILAMDGCWRLERLPDRFGAVRSSITRLAMDGCWRLERLPDRFGAVPSLRRLSLYGCNRLKKLPESFSQLKYLEYLNLSWCENLEELCEHFKGLSSLRVLLLAKCRKLEKLPEDFLCLPSLDTLDLTDCRMLEGKSMEGIVKLKKLQTVVISRSPSLLEKWGEIQKQCDQSWSFAVETREGSLQGKGHFSITNGQGKAFNISDLPLNTDLLVLFDCQQVFRHCSTLTLIEENMDDNLEMIYFGNHFSKLPHKVARGIRGHAPAKLFGQLFPLHLAYQREEEFELSAIRAEIVPGEKGEKTLSCGQILDNESVEEFVVEKCGRYLTFKQLVETPRESNIELLRELFANGEEKRSYGFLKNGESAKVGVEELKGKRILLDMRPASLCYDIPLQSLVDLYNVAEKERFDFEIITIPMMQENTRSDVSNSFSREVPWLVLQNPRELPNATKYFLVEGSEQLDPGSWDELSWEMWYPSEMRVIESNGTIAAYNSPGILCMVNTWGTEAFPFTEGKRRELMDKEVKQGKEMSNLMFLFQHLQRISEQVEKAMRQQKMFWLCIGDWTTYMKSMLVEWIDNIYPIYIPFFYACEGEMEYVYFTDGRAEGYWPLQHPTAATQVEMEGMCSLSLSEHEAIRFWARLRSLSLGGIFDYMGKLPDFTWLGRIYEYKPCMIIMDEDGNRITTQGKEIINDKAKALVQQLINGDKESRKETLIELEELIEEIEEVEEAWSE